MWMSKDTSDATSYAAAAAAALSDVSTLRAAEVAATDCSGAAVAAKARDDEGIFQAVLEWQQQRRHQHLRQWWRAEEAAAGYSGATEMELGAVVAECAAETTAAALCHPPMPG